MIVVSVNGLIIVDHISELNHGICLVEQEICPMPKALVPPTLFLVIVKNMDMKIRLAWLLPTISTV